MVNTCDGPKDDKGSDTSDERLTNERIYVESTRESANYEVDRHHGWYTETNCPDQASRDYRKRPCDYIVRTSFITNTTNLTSYSTEEDPSDNSLQEDDTSGVRRHKLLPSLSLLNPKLPKLNKVGKFRVNLILRLRSIWSRTRSQSQGQKPKSYHKHHYHHHQHHHSKELYNIEACKSMKVENTDHTKNMLVNDGRTVPQMKSSGSHNSQIIIHKHYHSDCCLLQPFYVHSRIISKCSHIHYHFYYQYPKSTCKESLFNSEEKDLNKISNQVSNLNLLSPSNHSLSTGNICCLYALKCVPSIECVASQLSSPCQQQQEIFSENKRSSPTITSIMMNRRNNARLISPFEKLKYHPCYQDRERHLGKWIQEILTHTGDSDENDDGDDNSDENPDGGNQNNSKVTKNKAVDNTNTNNFSRNRMYSSLKHVRFADESACSSSVTTLNSLSRSSSFSSLNISNTSLSGVSCSHISNLCPDSDWAISDRLLSQSSISKEFLFSNLRPKQLIKRTTNNRNNTYNDHGNNSENASDRRQHIKNNHTETPLVTVNLFHNTSEPPEVPQHVLNQLESIKKWKPQFTNPINCTYFIQRLLEQKVCLCNCWSNSFHSIHVQVKTIASSQGYPDFSAEVRLRYTLDHWQTYTECSPLTKLDHLTESNNDFQSIETYESEVKLHFVLINETSLFSTELKSYQLEFAVVYRGSGYEYWDNNYTKNYLCCL